MPSGSIVYFNGRSGWIKQEGVENLPTSQANDRFFEVSDIVENSPAQTVGRGTRLVFTSPTSTNDGPHKAKNATTA